MAPELSPRSRYVWLVLQVIQTAGIGLANPVQEISEELTDLRKVPKMVQQTWRLLKIHPRWPTNPIFFHISQIFQVEFTGCSTNWQVHGPSEPACGSRILIKPGLKRLFQPSLVLGWGRIVGETAQIPSKPHSHCDPNSGLSPSLENPFPSTFSQLLVWLGKRPFSPWTWSLEWRCWTVWSLGCFLVLEYQAKLPRPNLQETVSEPSWECEFQVT